MPRDAGGIYTLPDGYLAVTGETVLPSNHNPPLEDLATAMTNSVPRNGAAAMTDNLQLGGHQIKAVGDATADTDVPSFKQAKGALLSGTVTAQASLSLNLSTFISAGYTRFRIHLFNLRPATNYAVFGAAVSTNAGSTFLSSGIFQEAVEYWGNSGHGQYSEATLGVSSIYIVGELESAASSFQIVDMDLSSGHSFWRSSGHSQFIGLGSGSSRNDAMIVGVVNYITLGFDTGNISTLTYAVEGFR